MRTLALVTIGTILVSGISIFFVFDFSIKTYLLCLWGLQGCDPEAMGFLASVGMLFIGVFILIDVLVIYFAMLFVRLMEMSGGGRKVTLKELIRERRNLERAKELVEKRYYKRDIDEGTYNKLIQDYEEQLIKLKIKTDSLKKKKKKIRKREKNAA